MTGDKRNEWRVNDGFDLGYDHRKNVVGIHQLLVLVTMDCNLKCPYCAHFCDVNHGGIESESILFGLKAWSRKLSPKILNIMGGEPLLQNDLELLLRSARQFYPEADIWLTTNGTLLKNQDRSFFDSVKEAQTEIHVSDHTQTDAQQREIDESLRQMEEGITIYRRNNYSNWYKTYEYDESGSPCPSWSDNAGTAWANCTLRRRCTTLIGDTIYRCAKMACAEWGVRHGTMRKEYWDFATNVPKLSPNSSPEDVFNFYFDQSPLDLCAACGSGTLYPMR